MVYTDENGQRMAQRLRDTAKGRGTNTAVLQMRYAQAGALHRIVEAFGDSVVLKGGSLYFVEFGDQARPTSDLDLHSAAMTSERLADMVTAALETDLGDGLRLEVVGTQVLAIGDDDAGARVWCIGWLGEVRNNFHVDCAAGAPCEVEWKDYPVVLKGGPTFRVPCQPWEGVAADKLAAFVSKGFGNTRVRDAYDLMRLMPRLDADVVAQRVVSTFEAKGVDLPEPGEEIPSLTPEWAAERQSVWTKWQRRVGAVGLPQDLGGIVVEVAPWARDVLDRAHALSCAVIPSAPAPGRGF